MTELEFVEATARIENYYEKELNLEQRKFWYEQLKNMPLENYKKIIVEILKTCKYLPKYADIQEIMKNTQYSIRAEEKPKIYVPCKICGNSGLIRFYKEWDGKKYEFHARCTCENAKNYEWRNKKGEYVIPTAVELNLI